MVQGCAFDFGPKRASLISVFEAFAEQPRLNSAEQGGACIRSNRKIFSGGYKGGGEQKYTVVNPHTDHLRVEMYWKDSRGHSELSSVLKVRGKVTD